MVVSRPLNTTSDFDGGFEGNIYIEHAFVISIGKSKYLAFDGYCNNENATIFTE